MKVEDNIGKEMNSMPKKKPLRGVSNKNNASMSTSRNLLRRVVATVSEQRKWLRGQ